MNGNETFRERLGWMLLGHALFAIFLVAFLLLFRWIGWFE